MIFLTARKALCEEKESLKFCFSQRSQRSNGAAFFATMHALRETVFFLPQRTEKMSFAEIDCCVFAP